MRRFLQNRPGLNVSFDQLIPVTAPETVAGIVWSLEADKGLGLADGASVAAWVDQGPNGINGVQAVGAAQPIFKSAGFNSHPGVLFNGTTQFMTADAVAPLLSGNKQPYTMIWVGNWIAPAGSSFIYSASDAPGATGIFHGMTGSTNLLNLIREDVTLHSDAITTYRVQNLWTIPATWVFWYDGAVGRVYRNGVLGAETAFTGGTATMINLTFGAHRIGSTVSHPSNIMLAAISAFNVALSNSALHGVLGYYRRAFGI